jgi:ribosomal protein S18 acetylase RimI-like enzyme
MATRMLRIRTAESPDLSYIAAIHVAAWRAAYRGIIPDAVIDALTVKDRLASWKAWSNASEWPSVHLSVAEHDGKIVGFCRLGPAIDRDNPPPNFAEVTHLYVSPGLTGEGIGHALFTEALERSRNEAYDGLLVWVLEENSGARRFYSAHGLSFDGARHTEPDWLGEGIFEVRYRVGFLKAPPPDT